SQFASGASAESMAASAVAFTLAAAVALGIAVAYARTSARTTVFTVTSRRIVIRSGVAIPLSVNLPFSQIENADVRDLGDGFGDIAITPKGGANYVLLWPYVRPWRFLRAQPMLRSIPDARAVAEQLADALRDEVAAEAHRPEAVRAAASETEPAREKGGLIGPMRNQKLPMVAAAGLVGLAVVATLVIVLSGNAPQTYANAEVVASVDLRFVHRDDRSIDVVDADTGSLLESIAPGESGFLRSAVGVFERSRSYIDPDSIDSPFNLRWTASGRLFLFDPIRDTYVDVMAFGDGNADVFLRLLPEEGDGASKESEFTRTSEETLPVPTAALAKQDAVQ
ncbi:MAG: photosynthetic complex putative assembly protein PuhB, partial [Pseudomonadota bacterium]